MTVLVDFVAHPEWNDLHVMAVMVLSNLLEDLESLEVLISIHQWTDSLSFKFYPLSLCHVYAVSWLSPKDIRTENTLMTLKYKNCDKI